MFYERGTFKRAIWLFLDCRNDVEIFYVVLVNLRNRTGEERRRQTLCDKCDNFV